MLKSGQKVVVKAGKFAGYDATVVSVTDNNAVVTFNTDQGEHITIELPQSQLEKVK